MIAPSGIFDYRNDNPENLSEYSNVLVLDFDHFQSHLDAGEFKKKLIDNADRLHVLCALVFTEWIRSKSGNDS